VAGDMVKAAWARLGHYGAIWPRSRIAQDFAAFGDGSIICFPWDSLVNPHGIQIGEGTLLAPHTVLSAGWGPGHPDLADDVVVIGDRCVIGRGSSIVGHRSIRLGNDVWTGHHVHITDMNHGYDSEDLPIGAQFQDERPISIGDGSWIGHGCVILPGAQIGHHAVIGAGSVVTGVVPDRTIAVGSPARVVRELR
jgi:acetyltransferase-like isoleucine patch superfamily enzyme